MQILDGLGSTDSMKKWTGNVLWTKKIKKNDAEISGNYLVWFDESLLPAFWYKNYQIISLLIIPQTIWQFKIKLIFL